MIGRCIIYLLVVGAGLLQFAFCLSQLFFMSTLQFIRFLRRNEGVEAARKYFLDSHKSPNCTYHIYVAYAMMAFCLDKDSKVGVGCCTFYFIFKLSFTGNKH